MSKYLYIVDAGNSWALADDTPQVRAMLDETPDIWEEQIDPVSVNEIEL